MKPIAYVAGPYTADTIDDRNANIQQARDAAVSLWAKGYTVICPHLNTAGFELEPSCKKIDWVEHDLDILAHCNLIVMVGNWKKSTGAQTEHAFAKVNDISIFYGVDDVPKI